MMQKPRRLIALSLLATVLASAVFLTRVSAEDSPTTDAQINRIRSSCLSVKSTLNQLKVSDALLRVNRGQIYESMTTKLMSRFNDRVSSNNLDAKDLIAVTKNYNTTFTLFKLDYQNYAEQIANAIKIDCSKEPVSFYDAVSGARSKRTQVHNDVIILDQYIDEYTTAFDAFAATVKDGVNN